MSDTLHSFRCPVCSHVDEASTGAGETAIECSHCGTALALASPVRARWGSASGWREDLDERTVRPLRYRDKGHLRRARFDRVQTRMAPGECGVSKGCHALVRFL